MRTVCLLSPDLSRLKSWSALISPICPVLEVHDLAQLTRASHQEAIVFFHLAWLKTALGHALLQQALDNAQLRVVIFADVPVPAEGLRYLAMGAYGYANVNMQVDLLLKLIEVVALGQLWVNPAVMAGLVSRMPAQQMGPSLAHLTAREQVIAKQVAQGDSNKAIAAALDITERTVKAHLSAIYKKTGCQDRLKLALYLNNTVSRVQTH